MNSCQSVISKNAQTNDSSSVRLIVLEPGHFHAALVQKSMYPGVDSTVHLYAPEGPELQSYLSLIKTYNERSENPTHWIQEGYTGNDYANKFLEEKKGNVLVLAGNNQRKTEYISKAVNAGIHVLADKPMAINTNDFELLLRSFEEAAKNNVLLYDIMTERSEITTILQKELVHMPDVFGEMKKGTSDDPSIHIEGVHFFYKQVSGKPLTRPSWFFDPIQEGDGIADVGTHLVDLVQWQSFPEIAIDYKKDIQILSARIWPTPLSLSQYSNITKETSFPAFLQQYVKDSMLQTHANGEINYTIKGIHARVITRWDYEAAEGGDTHYSMFKGTKADILIQQGKAENFRPTLNIFPGEEINMQEYETALKQALTKLEVKYPGIGIERFQKGWKLIIPEKYKVGHEAHFGEVMERYLQYLRDGSLPNWEVPNMKAKYYTTTKALEMAGSK